MSGVASGMMKNDKAGVCAGSCASAQGGTSGSSRAGKDLNDTPLPTDFDPATILAKEFAISSEQGGERKKLSAVLTDYFVGIAAVTGCTLANLALRSYFDPANLVMVYLLGAIYIAITRGVGPAFLSTVLGVLVFDLIFVPPVFIVTVSDTQYLFTVATMFVVAIIVGRLTERIRRQVREVHAKEVRTRIMLSMTRELAGTRGAVKLLHTATTQITKLYGFLAVAYLDEASGFATGPDSSEHVLPVSRSGEVAHWVMENGRAAGMGTKSHSNSDAMYLPISGVGGTVAVLAVWPQPLGTAFTLEQVHLLESLAWQVGLMLDLERLEGERLRHQLEAQSERLKTSLLSTVTHDIQTPLAAIMGSAESLILHGGEMEPDERSVLAKNVYGEAARLSRLVANLLRMTKLQSGAVKPDFQLQPVDEALGAALVLMEPHMAGRELSVDIPPDLPLLALDAVLMEQLFLNILENSVRYTPPGTPVDITVTLGEGSVLIEMADRGPGLADSEFERIFDLFYQGERHGASGGRTGYGVGLAVCRAIAQVHGGTLKALNREGGGAAFRLTLPVPDDPTSAAHMMEER